MLIPHCLLPHKYVWKYIYLNFGTIYEWTNGTAQKHNEVGKKKCFEHSTMYWKL